MRLHRDYAPSPRTGRFILAASLLFGAGCTNSLNRAIYREHPEAIQKFLAAGANVNEANEDGGTPLIYAAQHGDLALIKILVERGATVNWVDHEGNSPLGYLASGEKSKNDAVAFLLTRGADINFANKTGHTPLHLAVMRRRRPEEARPQTELVAMLLGAGADVNRQTQRGELPLHLAAAAGQPDQVLAQLIQGTREPQALTGSGYTALSEAAQAGQHQAALFLVGHGFEPQKLAPAPARLETQFPLALEVSYPIDARAYEAMGDYLLGRSDRVNALASYQRSAIGYEAAVADCQQVVNRYTEALKDAKAGRKGRLFSTIALNALGVGLGAATGVGFYAVPKRADNPIDDYADELERDQAELAKRIRDQSDLTTKLHEVEITLKAENTAREAAAPAAPTTLPAESPDRATGKP